MFNQVIMAGRLTRDPELKTTTGGKSLCNMSMAINDPFDKDKVLFMDVVVWGKTAENCSKYLAKGKQLIVSGRLEERSWDKDGETIKRMQIVASNVSFIGGKTEAGPILGQGKEPF